MSFLSCDSTEPQVLLAPQSAQTPSLAGGLSRRPTVLVKDLQSYLEGKAAVLEL